MGGEWCYQYSVCGCNVGNTKTKPRRRKKISARKRGPAHSVKASSGYSCSPRGKRWQRARYSSTESLPNVALSEACRIDDSPIPSFESFGPLLWKLIRARQSFFFSVSFSNSVLFVPAGAFQILLTGFASVAALYNLKLLFCNVELNIADENDVFEFGTGLRLALEWL